MPRGGRRQGAPGARYANRTDLAQGPRQLPVATAPNQPYGEAGQQQAAQQAVPMASGPMNNSAPAPQDPVEAAKSFNPPPVVPLSMPTLRPDEHVMTGLNTPPAQPAFSQSPVLKGVALLNAVPNPSPEIQALRRVMNAAQANEAAP